MKHPDRWKPTKFVYRRGRLRASRDLREVGVGSRLMGDLIAANYQTYLPRYAKGKLADLGCGKVPLYETYRPHTTEVVCIDWANTFHRNEHLDFECDLTRPLPLPDAEFDTIILSDVLEHIPEPELLWREMDRILKPEGVIFLNVPFYYWLHETPHDFYRYTEFALRRFAENRGLKVLQLHSLGGMPEIVADILAKHLKVIPVLGAPLSMAVQALTRLFVGTSIGRRISHRSGQKFPFGYFLIVQKAPAESAPAASRELASTTA